MAMNPYNQGLPPVSRWRPVAPQALYAMSRDEIVELYVGYGYSRKMAERDADAWVAHRDGASPERQREEVQRNDSVSENSIGARLRAPFDRRA